MSNIIQCYFDLKTNKQNILGRGAHQLMSNVTQCCFNHKTNKNWGGDTLPMSSIPLTLNPTIKFPSEIEIHKFQFQASKTSGKEGRSPNCQHFPGVSIAQGHACQGFNCIVIHELLITTKMAYDELSGIHTPDLPHLLL